MRSKEYLGERRANLMHGSVSVKFIEGDSCEFILGRFTAYGSYENRRVYSIDHAPDDASFDAISEALRGGR